MNYGKLLFLIPILVGMGIAGTAMYSLVILNEGIVDNLNTPINDPILTDDINHDLTCFKVGLYTNWDEGWVGDFTSFITGIDVGDHARQMFFEYGCNCNDSTRGMKNWISDKICLAELHK